MRADRTIFRSCLCESLNNCEWVSLRALRLKYALRIYDGGRRVSAAGVLGLVKPFSFTDSLYRDLVCFGYVEVIRSDKSGNLMGFGRGVNWRPDFLSL